MDSCDDAEFFELSVKHISKGIVKKTGLLMLVPHLLWLLKSGDPKYYCSVSSTLVSLHSAVFWCCVAAKLQGYPKIGFELICWTTDYQALQSLMHGEVLGGLRVPGVSSIMNSQAVMTEQGSNAKGLSNPCDCS